MQSCSKGEKGEMNYQGQPRADLGGAWGAEAPPLQNFTMSKLGKLLEAVVQVQLHFMHMYGQ